MIDEYQQRMYSTIPNLTIGFHGCDETVFEKIVHKGEILHKSTHDYDWLGNGMYFWEQNLGRAWLWAKEHNENPAVIGAVIDLGYCLNLLDNRSVQLLKRQYSILKLKSQLTSQQLKFNKNVKNNTDLLLRYLDCAVIEDLHKEREKDNERNFDTVRGLFLEGEPIYETSGFFEKTHIQICVRNPNCIKGFFIPRNPDTNWKIV